VSIFKAWIFFKLQIDNLKTFSNKKLMNVVYSNFFFEFDVLEKRRFLINITEQYKKFIYKICIKVIIDFDNRIAYFFIVGTRKLKKYLEFFLKIFIFPLQIINFINFLNFNKLMQLHSQILIKILLNLNKFFFLKTFKKKKVTLTNYFFNENQKNTE
jgi:hypothetical protein